MPSLRKMMDEHPTVVTIVAVLLLFAALTAIVINLRGPGTGGMITHVWFYDVNTGELFATEMSAVPPIAAPSDPPGTPDAQGHGVRAHVFACGDCRKEQFVAYVERYPAQVRERLVAMMQNPDDMNPEMYTPDMMESQLISAPESNEWVSIMSERGMQLQTSLLERCPDTERPVPCFPG